MNVLTLTAYMRMPFHRYFTTLEAIKLSGQKHQIMYRYLLAWSEAGLVDGTEYEGTDFRVRMQYRRLFNKVTITKDGVLFEVVKEE